MAEGRPVPDGWRTEPALPHRGCPCPAFRRGGHGAEASPGGVLLRRGVNAGGDGVHSPRRAVDDPVTGSPGLTPAFAPGGEERSRRPPGRALRNIHPSGGLAAEGCDAGAHSGLVRRVRGAAVRRSPPAARPPAGFRTAGSGPPCPSATSARGQPGRRHCRMPHWSCSPCRSRRSQTSLNRSALPVTGTGHEPTLPNHPEPSGTYCFPPLLVKGIAPYVLWIFSGCITHML